MPGKKKVPGSQAARLPHIMQAYVQSVSKSVTNITGVEAFIVWNSAFIHWETLSEHVYMFTFIH